MLVYMLMKYSSKYLVGGKRIQNNCVENEKNMNLYVLSLEWQKTSFTVLTLYAILNFEPKHILLAFHMFFIFIFNHKSVVYYHTTVYQSNIVYFRTGVKYLPYFLDYKMAPPQIWEENGGASYSPNVAYLAH